MHVSQSGNKFEFTIGTLYFFVLQRFHEKTFMKHLKEKHLTNTAVTNIDT